MAPKRKSDVLEHDGDASSSAGEFVPSPSPEPAAKKTKRARATSDAPDAPDASTSTDKPAKGKKGKEPAKKISWKDVKLEGEDEDGGVPVYDDCNEIRRKIRLLQKQPDFKITHWLKEIGNVNSNSFGRFMKATGPDGGASNGLYYAAYVYFEKVRVAEGKKKTPKRIRNEATYQQAIALEQRRYMWVMT
ncbi:hypothetical protein WOLCODRAFT_93659 [Wolfiporia cocos MD-104 SS10]|uniref:DUF7726 domain-containing protein n=1 Tax=Wolfiporia cocos (strain MD-104) TaxID=742152 RepID=A0A2H3IU73_WOLCO|nr:hypothetical protein WOLCODRAFT_93659 [Wolfiporia cocos MD-104 SS10]